MSVFDGISPEELGQMILDEDPRLKGIMTKAQRELTRKRREQEAIEAAEKLRKMRAARGLPEQRSRRW